MIVNFESEFARRKNIRHDKKCFTSTGNERDSRSRTRLSMSEVPVARSPKTEPRGLSRIDAAAYIGVSPTKFDELRKDGRISPPRLIDSRLVWDRYDLDRDFDAFPIEGKPAADEDWTVAVRRRYGQPLCLNVFHPAVSKTVTVTAIFVSIIALKTGPRFG